jgi:hypothetical protein
MTIRSRQVVRNAAQKGTQTMNRKVLSRIAVVAVLLAVVLLASAGPLAQPAEASFSSNTVYLYFTPKYSAAKFLADLWPDQSNWFDVYNIMVQAEKVAPFGELTSWVSLNSIYTSYTAGDPCGPGADYNTIVWSIANTGWGINYNNVYRLHYKFTPRDRASATDASVRACGGNTPWYIAVPGPYDTFHISGWFTSNSNNINTNDESLVWFNLQPTTYSATLKVQDDGPATPIAIDYSLANDLTFQNVRGWDGDKSHRYFYATMIKSQGQGCGADTSLTMQIHPQADYLELTITPTLGFSAADLHSCDASDDVGYFPRGNDGSQYFRFTSTSGNTVTYGYFPCYNFLNPVGTLCASFMNRTNDTTLGSHYGVIVQAYENAFTPANMFPSVNWNSPS